MSDSPKLSNLTSADPESLPGRGSPGYDHARKAGNRGDVWKHFILLAVIQALFEEAKTRFTFLETHAGAGEYNLNETGEWRSGIGRNEPLPSSLATQPYFVAEKASLADHRYLGSWLLVDRYLEDRRAPHKLVLFDSSSEVAARIQPVTKGKACSEFSMADGFDALNSCIPASLVMVDPPFQESNDWKRSGMAAQEMAARRQPFVIWYPIFWPTRPADLVRTAEASGLEIMWASFSAKPSQNMKGCGMVLGGGAEQTTRSFQKHLGELAVWLGGRFEVRAA